MPSRELLHLERQNSVLIYKEKYTVKEINLMGSGDILLLYTDGFYEHHNSFGEEYFKTKLENKLRETKTLPSKEIFNLIKEDLFNFGVPEDDLSFVVIKKT
jgi:serine phosphatase RsbU (regulator of sigma subunit)